MWYFVRMAQKTHTGFRIDTDLLNRFDDERKRQRRDRTNLLEIIVDWYLSLPVEERNRIAQGPVDSNQR